MKLRSGKILSTFFKPENQPFKLILMPEKVKRKEDYAENKGNYKVNIDFDGASKAWRKNKIHLGEAGFCYK